MTDNIKQIDPCALASITSGVLLCEAGFSVVAEAAEWLLGHPIWTHEYIDPEIKAALNDAVAAQYPALVLDPPADWRALVADIREAHGATVSVQRGCRQRDRGPIASLSRLLGGL